MVDPANTRPIASRRQKPGFRRDISFCLSLISLLSWSALAQPLVSPGSSSTQDTRGTDNQQATTLEQGKPVERHLAGGDVHAYSIQLIAGQFLKVIVEQRGIDLVVMAFGPDGKELAWVDSPTAAQGAEAVLIAAESSGSHRLEVRSVEEMMAAAAGTNPIGAAGSYEMRVDTLRMTLPEDKQSLAVFEMDNRASALGYFASVQERLGNNTEALEAYEKSLQWSEATGNKPQLAFTFLNLGRINFVQGNYSPALGYYRKRLMLSEELGNANLIANTLSRLSLVYANLGNLSEALDCAQRSLQIRESGSANAGTAEAHMSLGLVYGSIGDGGRALEHYRASLKLSQELGRKGLIANALEKIAAVYDNEGNYPQALEHAERALKINEELKANRQVIFSILTLGRIQQSRGEPVAALALFQKALALSEKAGDQQELGRAHNRISSVHLTQGNYLQALESAERAADIAREIGNLGLLLNALNNISVSYLYLDQLENARRTSGQAVEVVESLRANVAGNEARSNFFASRVYPYELSIEVLMRLHKQHPAEGYDVAALHMSERARARSLLESLSEARADIRQGVDPALLEKERTVQQRLNAAAARQTLLLSGRHTQDQAVRIKNEIGKLTSDYQQVETQIQRSSPRYAALTQPAPLSVREIQTDLLDADTALLEYALGEDRSYLWVVTPTSVDSFELPKRAAIEKDARRVVELLSDGQRWATNVQVHREYAEAASHLSRTLFPSEMISKLKAKRLVVVGDGALQYLPFGALPIQRSSLSEVASRKRANKIHNPDAHSNLQTLITQLPLIADYEIVSLPSASTLAVLRRETTKRARPTKSVAVLADPVFEITDERVHPSTRQHREGGSGQPAAETRRVKVDQSINSRALLRALQLKPNADAGGGSPERLRITRLPFTSFEAENILASAPKGQNLKATGFRANRDTATSANLAQYRIVHFATHGILNSEHPELSGIVLSLVNEHGQPTDGFLRAHEIYNLNLPADLVVLSACQTGLGKEIRGEGLVGLTRGFMYAGAPRVVASLWKVDDAATAELMKIFYRAMLQNNLPPAAALRAAKVEMWKHKRWSAPFYWAAFELQGEWK